MMMDFTDHFGKGNTHDLLWILEEKMHQMKTKLQEKWPNYKKDITEWIGVN